MKPFLLIIGEGYYPSSGTGDWVKCFETREEAEQFFEKQDARMFNKIVAKDGTVGDWYEIVDLRDWIN